MAHKNPIASWLYKNSDKYAIRFKLADWTTRYSFDLFDYEVTGEFQGVKLTSRGLDANKEIALEKACSEFLERMVCVVEDLNSEGMAVSATVDAALHARNELLERYYLRQHLTGKIGFREIDSKKFMLSSKVEKQFNSSVNFYQMKANGGFGIVCKTQSYALDQVFSFGFSYSDNQNHSIEKSLMEALPNFVWKMENPDFNTENVWQLSNDFKMRISLLLGKICDQEISTPIVNQILINTNNLFCNDINGLMVCKFKAN